MAEAILTLSQALDRAQAGEPIAPFAARRAELPQDDDGCLGELLLGH
jgi:hypothetical protein